MSLNVGHLVGYLELDDKKFNRSAERADKKMTALQLHLKALAATNPKIQIDVETRKLDELKVKMADLKAQAARGVDVRVEVAQALVEIDRVESKLRMLHNREVRIDVDNRSALSKIGAVGSKINGLWASVLGLGPMLIPIAGAAAGGIAAIGSASVAAATGVGVLATAFAGMGKATEALSKYRESVEQAGPKAKIQAAQLALGVQTARAGQANSDAAVRSAQAAYAKKPTAANAARVAAAKRSQALAPSKLQIALQKQAMGPQSLVTAKNTLDKSPYGDQTKAGKAFAHFTLDDLKPATSRLHAAAQSAVLPGVERGLKRLLPLVPLFDRIITHVGLSLGDMADRAGKALNDPFWRHFFLWISQTAGPELTIMGHTFGMFIEGIARTMQRFGPQGQSLILWVDKLATKFNAWSAGGAGSSFQRFMDYIAHAGPEIVAVLKPLGSIVGNLLAGMSQSGMGELKVFGLLLSGIAHLPAGAIQMIGATLPLIVLSLKGMQVVSAVAAGMKVFGDVMKALPGKLSGTASAISGTKAALAGFGATAGIGIATAGVENKKHKALGYGEAIGGGALTGAAVGSVVPVIGTATGAAIGGTIGGLVKLASQLNTTKHATKTGAGAWDDYATTLGGVTAHMTRATRALAYDRMQKSGILTSVHKLGLTDRDAVLAVTGNKDARKKLAEALDKENRFHGAGLTAAEIKALEDETGAIGKSRLAQLQKNVALAVGRKELEKAQAALAAFKATDGTAKVGLTGTQKTLNQLHSIRRALKEVWGLAPGGQNAGPGGIGALLNPGGGSTAGSGGIGALLSVGVTAPHRALGGPVAAGHAYKVNENGLEVFVPSMSGRIVSNHNAQQMLGGDGGGRTQLYGDVYLSPHNYGEFVREMEGDRRRAGLDGRRRSRR